MGLSDGWLLAYEYPSLDRVESKQIFWEEEKEVQSSLINNRYYDGVETPSPSTLNGLLDKKKR